MMTTCTLGGCDIEGPHGHGTDVTYGEAFPYSTDKFGTFDERLFAAYRAGAIEQERWRVRKEMGLEAGEPSLALVRMKFEEWRATL